MLVRSLKMSSLGQLRISTKMAKAEDDVPSYEKKKKGESDIYTCYAIFSMMVTDNVSLFFYDHDLEITFS